MVHWLHVNISPTRWKSIHVNKDYVSKWIETVATPINGVYVMTKFLVKYILCSQSTPRAIVSDEGTHFFNKLFENLMTKYGIQHKVLWAYHPRSNGQDKLSNRDIKGIFEKVVNTFRKDWSKHFDDALWTYITAFKTPLRMFPYRLV